MFTKWSNFEAMSLALFLSQVCSRAALARVRAGAKREPGRAKHQEDERGLKPRDYILDLSFASIMPEMLSAGGKRLASDFGRDSRSRMLLDFPIRPSSHRRFDRGGGSRPLEGFANRAGR